MVAGEAGEDVGLAVPLIWRTRNITIVMFFLLRRSPRVPQLPIQQPAYLLALVGILDIYIV